MEQILVDAPDIPAHRGRRTLHGTGAIASRFEPTTVLTVMIVRMGNAPAFTGAPLSLPVTGGSVSARLPGGGAGVTRRSWKPGNKKRKRGTVFNRGLYGLLRKKMRISEYLPTRLKRFHHRGTEDTEKHRETIEWNHEKHERYEQCFVSQKTISCLSNLSCFSW
jgi:hypothetical protein